MYFQSLEDIMGSNGTNKINRKLVEQFDFWLASRRTAVKNYLCPNNFSKYSGVDEEISLGLFVLASKEEYNVLKPRYDIYIREKGLRINSVYNEKDIPRTYIDPETEVELPINLDEDIRVYFELLEEPSEKPSVLNNDEGKSFGVGLTDFNKAKLTTSYYLNEDNN